MNSAVISALPVFRAPRRCTRGEPIVRVENLTIGFRGRSRDETCCRPARPDGARGRMRCAGRRIRLRKVRHRAQPRRA